MVGISGRAKKAVAPNSPTDTAKANPAPTRTARITRGRSTSLHTRAGGGGRVGRPSRPGMEGGGPTPGNARSPGTVSYTHLRAHETDSYLVCRLLLEKKKQGQNKPLHHQ